MVTRDELAAQLRTVNVEDVAREANVSIKTIYRLRNKKTSPSLDTVAALLGAISRLRKPAKAA